MAVPRHLEEASLRLEDAAERVELARAASPTPEAMKKWLEALTDYVLALADIHEFTNQSVHEKLHLLAGHLGLKEHVLFHGAHGAVP